MTGAPLRQEPAFHDGEVALQREEGVAERMGRVGAQVIRGHMPEQHRDFFSLLPFIVVGSLDDARQPAASMLAAPPGFVVSPTPDSLRVDALPHGTEALARNLGVGAPVGVLGIQPHTRRRNRVNGIVTSQDDIGFTVQVQQSFGNCPKYIEPREASYVGAPVPAPTRESETLEPRARALMASADTFFLASAHPEAGRSSLRTHGVDVSHRGGPRGFVHFVDEQRFIVPDFKGNDFFNTLGNVRLLPAVGLLFLDFSGGDVLELDATAVALAGEHPLAHPAATGRIVRFDVQRARFWPNASPLRWLG
jgi:uncharacterized protein